MPLMTLAPLLLLTILCLTTAEPEPISHTFNITIANQTTTNITIPLDGSLFPLNTTSFYLAIQQTNPNIIVQYTDGDGRDGILYNSEIPAYAFFSQCCEKIPLVLFLENLSNGTVDTSVEVTWMVPSVLVPGETYGELVLDGVNTLTVFWMDLVPYVQNLTFPAYVSISSCVIPDIICTPGIVSAPIIVGLGKIPEISYPCLGCQIDYNIGNKESSGIAIPLNTPEDLGEYFITVGCNTPDCDPNQYSYRVAISVSILQPDPLILDSTVEQSLSYHSYQYYSLNLTSSNISISYPSYVELYLQHSGLIIYIAKNYLPSEAIHDRSLIHDDKLISTLDCLSDSLIWLRWKSNEIIVLNSEADLGIYHILLIGYSTNYNFYKLTTSLKQPEALSLGSCNTMLFDIDVALIYKISTTDKLQSDNVDIIYPPIPDITGIYNPQYRLSQGSIPVFHQGNETSSNDFYLLVWNLDNQVVCLGKTIYGTVQSSLLIPFGITVSNESNPCNSGECKVDMLSNEAFCQCSSFYKGDKCQFACPQSQGVLCSGKGSCIEDALQSSAICTCLPDYLGHACQLNCDTSNCTTHGTCKVSTFNKTEIVICQCYTGYIGTHCQFLCSRETDCSGHGTCVGTMEAGCACDLGWGGMDCSEADTSVGFLDVRVWIQSINSIVAVVAIGLLSLVVLFGICVECRRRRNREPLYDYLENR